LAAQNASLVGNIAKTIQRTAFAPSLPLLFTSLLENLLGNKEST